MQKRYPTKVILQKLDKPDMNGALFIVVTMDNYGMDYINWGGFRTRLDFAEQLAARASLNVPAKLSPLPIVRVGFEKET